MTGTRLLAHCPLWNLHLATTSQWQLPHRYESRLQQKYRSTAHSGGVHQKEDTQPCSCWWTAMPPWGGQAATPPKVFAVAGNALSHPSLSLWACLTGLGHPGPHPHQRRRKARYGPDSSFNPACSMAIPWEHGQESAPSFHSAGSTAYYHRHHCALTPKTVPADSRASQGIHTPGHSLMEQDPWVLPGQQTKPSALPGLGHQTLSPPPRRCWPTCRSAPPPARRRHCPPWKPQRTRSTGSRAPAGRCAPARGGTGFNLSAWAGVRVRVRIRSASRLCRAPGAFLVPRWTVTLVGSCAKLCTTGCRVLPANKKDPFQKTRMIEGLCARPMHAWQSSCPGGRALCKWLGWGEAGMPGETQGAAAQSAPGARSAAARPATLHQGQPLGCICPGLGY